MTDKLLLPVRVPELGPALGRLTDRPDPAHPEPYAAARLRLVTRILEAAGEARRLAGAGERTAALQALRSPGWLDAWEEAVSGVAETLLADVDARLETAGRRSRMSRRRRSRLLPTAAERRGITARLGATGAALVAALDRLDAAADAAATATARDRAAMDGWRDALLSAARRVEAAWDRLLGEAAAERAAWDTEVAEAEAWRPPLWPVAVLGAPLLAAAIWVGLIVGGYREAPDWFARAWQAVFP